MKRSPTFLYSDPSCGKGPLAERLRRTVLRARARELVARFRQDSAQGKLGDVLLTVRAARNGHVVTIPASWDDEQHDLWHVLADYHHVSV